MKFATLPPIASRRLFRLCRIVLTVTAVCTVILAAAVVTTLTIDLGPALRQVAEEQGSRYLQRPMRIGRLSVKLWNGRYVVEDLVIEGLTPESLPFFTAKRIELSMPWRTLLDRRIVLETLELTDWRMHVELVGGRHNFPRFARRGSEGPRRWTTTLRYVRARGGEFTFQDHGMPWGVVARHVDIVVVRAGGEYRGGARFSDGLVAMQQYTPFRVDMDSTFKLEGGRVAFDRIDLTSEGARTKLVGWVDLGRWPEQAYELTSTLDFAVQKDIWFTRERFTASGTGEFTGTFRMFRDSGPDGRPRTGRELKGTIRSSQAGINAYRFTDFRAEVLWVPERMAVTNATAKAYGGTAAFEFAMRNLGLRNVRGTATFDARFNGVDLKRFTDFLQLDGIRLSGAASGRVRYQWPVGLWAERRGEGEIRLTPPPEVVPMTRRMPMERIAAREAQEDAVAPFSPHPLIEPVPVGGELAFAFDPEWIEIGPSRLATPDTYVEFEGRTAYGERSRIPFHVSSANWQESDRLLAGVLTALGSRTNAIPIGGYGTFDGVMLDAFRRPRIEGEFAGERMRAFGVVWGAVRGSVVIENGYADVSRVEITSGDAVMRAEGRFSIGFPRRDGGEEINARVWVERWPVVDLRRAFGLDEYDVDGSFSGEFDVHGYYRRPYGEGRMTIAGGVAYGEPFDEATGMVRLEGDGARLSNIEVRKGGGGGTGAAYVAWNGTYSFNFDARDIAIESVAALEGSPLPLSGILDFSAAGSGSVDAPTYLVRGTIRDLFAADEGIGQVVGTIEVLGDELTLKVEAASSRLAVSGSGRIGLTADRDAELTFTVADTSLDPYIRAYDSRLSPYTTAIASGTVRVAGKLADIDDVFVDATIDRFDARLFDYTLRNAAPIRIALDRHTVRIADMRLVGEGTELDVSGTVDLHDEWIAVRARGDANLAVLQGFVSNIRSTGRAMLAATLEGPLREPLVTGTMAIDNGRIRHFGAPHALENISGTVQFDSRSIRLDGLSAHLGGGPVAFGGTIAIEGYRPGRLDVTVAGTGMRVRFPEGMTSRIDAQLALEGTADATVLTGRVDVRDALYDREFNLAESLLEVGAGDVLAPPPSSGPTIPLRYNVQITAPGTLQVANRSFNLLASANLELLGTVDRPVLAGRAEVLRGEVIFEGRRYVVTRGTIDFTNPSRIEPFLDVEAETRVRVPGETYRVTIRATGTPDRLSAFTIDSDPPLPEYEVLALLFGGTSPGEDVEFRQYTSGETPQQALLRERMTRALTGVVSAEVGRVVEQTFGVDTFQLMPSLVDPNQQFSGRIDPAARVVIGKRLSDRVFLTYSRSLSSSTRDQIIVLEYDQTDRYSWIFSRNEDGTYALDVRVRRTF